MSIAYKQVHDQPQPLNQIVADVPAPFEAIVAKLLAKDPKLRYSSADALRDDLRRFRNGEPVQALVAAAARPRHAVGGSRPAADDRGATTPSPPRHARPAAADRRSPARRRPRCRATAGARPAGYPPGASADARYYEDHHSRTGLVRARRRSSP